MRIITPYPDWNGGTYPVILSDMPERDYHAHRSISKSSLDLFNRSPAHYKFAAARQPTRHMAIGSAIHCALLEPARFETDYLILDVADRRASEWREAKKQRGTDEYILTRAEADGVLGMQAAVFANPQTHDLLNQPHDDCEISVFAHDPETGLLCRARVDLLGDTWALDLKKTQDARADAFSRAIGNYRYHVQAAFYSDVIGWATGTQPERFKFLAVEENPPHANRVYTLDDEAMAAGRAAYRADLTRYAECVETDEWPAYDDEPELIGLPGWMLAEIESEMEILTDE